MFDTNAVLAASLSIIAHFHSVLSPLGAGAPPDIADIQHYLIGSPVRPNDVYIDTKAGASYALRNGSVWRYQGTNSFSHLQDPALIAAFIGQPKLSTNEITVLAQKVVRDLSHGRFGALSNGPTLTAAGEYKGARIQSYSATWPSTDPEIGFAALVEINARSGLITFVWLRDPSFYDDDEPRQLNLLTPSAEPATTSHRKRVPASLSITNHDAVVPAIKSWLRLCARIGIDPGTHTNLTDVKWDESCTLTNADLSKTTPMFDVDFNDGTRLRAFEGAIVSAALPDKYFTADRLDGLTRDNGKFHGKIRNDWYELANQFERSLESGLHLPTAALSNLTATPSFGEFKAAVGSTGLKRVVVCWRKLPPMPPGATSQTILFSQLKTGFAVEFDTQTGEVKGFAFADPVVTMAFVRAQLQEFR